MGDIVSQIAKGKKHLQVKAIEGTVAPLYDRVVVRDMKFGDTTTNGGIIVLSDDGKDRGIHPRWGKVVKKGKDNEDPYTEGNWILIEHGRWTRGFEVEFGEEEPVTCRVVEAEAVLMWSDEEPKDIFFNEDTIDTSRTSDHRPEDFAGKFEV